MRWASWRCAEPQKIFISVCERNILGKREGDSSGRLWKDKRTFRQFKSARGTGRNCGDFDPAMGKSGKCLRQPGLHRTGAPEKTSLQPRPDFLFVPRIGP
jgi:hypothetical protein